MSMIWKGKEKRKRKRVRKRKGKKRIKKKRGEERRPPEVKIKKGGWVRDDLLYFLTTHTTTPSTLLPHLHLMFMLSVVWCLYRNKLLHMCTHQQPLLFTSSSTFSPLLPCARISHKLNRTNDKNFFPSSRLWSCFVLSCLLLLGRKTRNWQCLSLGIKGKALPTKGRLSNVERIIINTNSACGLQHLIASERRRVETKKRRKKTTEHKALLRTHGYLGVGTCVCV